jgi:hypothetical protein
MQSIKLKKKNSETRALWISPLNIDEIKSNKCIWVGHETRSAHAISADFFHLESQKWREISVNAEGI